MEQYCNDNTFTTSLSVSTDPHQSISTSAPPRATKTPCAACKILRRRCTEKCSLAPYFPPTDMLRFAISHKVFGASNIMKLLQEIPEHQRADAVDSLVYEANARIRDPIYGCAGAIFGLQKQISELQEELAKAQAEILLLNLKIQSDHQPCINQDQQPCQTTSFSSYDQNIYSIFPDLTNML